MAEKLSYVKSNLQVIKYSAEFPQKYINNFFAKRTNAQRYSDRLCISPPN